MDKRGLRGILRQAPFYVSKNQANFWRFFPWEIDSLPLHSAGMGL